MTDCLIIGGGLIGMLSAWELRQSGLSVTIVEQGACGKESSWAGGGILSPLYPWRYSDAVTALAHWSQAYYPDFLQLLYEKSGVDPQLQNNGLLILDTDEACDAENWAQKWGYTLEQVDAKTIRSLEPSLGEVPDSALWLPGVAHVRNPRLLKALKESLLNQGVEIREYCAVKGLSLHGKAVQGVQTETDTLTAGIVVLSGGAWSGQLLASTGNNLPVQPVRGQMILYRGEADVVSRIILSKDRYVIARRDGRVLVGSTLEQTGFDKSTTESARNELAAEALRLVPALQKYEIEHHWAGLRPGSPEGIPYICAHPDLSGLFINTGHFRNGVVLGLASSRLLADLLLGREAIVAADAYQISAPISD
ncbi:Glycine oxidase ThiO [hydrothermal vent metagenome]|uniref:Glycine oxidase ThiO n=1 Tax=hydrothermal vent metagenome TaxID=652676 RepID=A0A3B1AVH6_9ZZZZ